MTIWQWLRDNYGWEAKKKPLLLLVGGFVFALVLFYLIALAARGLGWL